LHSVNKSVCILPVAPKVQKNYSIYLATVMSAEL